MKGIIQQKNNTWKYLCIQQQIGKYQWPHKSLGWTYLLELDGSLQRWHGGGWWGEWWLLLTAGINTVAVLANIHSAYEPSWKPSFPPQDLTEPNSSVGSSAGRPPAIQPSEPHPAKDRLLRSSWAQCCPLEEQDPAPFQWEQE